MKQYINRRIMIISAAAILLTAVFCTMAYYRVFREEVMDNLRICSKMIPSNGQIDDDRNLRRYAADLYDDNIRLTLIRPDGSVAFDNIAPVEDLDNHRNREEIEQAYKAGEGSSVRLSKTIHRTNYYYAILLRDGSVLRTARESYSIFHIFYRALPLIILSAAVLLVICYVTSRRLTMGLLSPVETLVNNMDNPQYHSPYVELDPILSHIQQQHKDIMEHANMRQEFTANISHELKTPLTVISGYSELMENGLVADEDIRKFAGEIYKNSSRLLSLINDILRLSEIDVTREEDVETEEIDLYEVAAACVESLEVKAESLGVNLSMEGEPTTIQANRDMVEELIYNLCDNGIRYNKPGGYVHVFVKDKSMCVSDNGIGIPEELQARVFERFFRVDKSRSRKTGGTGLGLAIVKHIASLHRASVSLESQPDKGTTITVYFSDK